MHSNIQHITLPAHPYFYQPPLRRFPDPPWRLLVITLPLFIHKVLLISTLTQVPSKQEILREDFGRKQFERFNRTPNFVFCRNIQRLSKGCSLGGLAFSTIDGSTIHRHIDNLGSGPTLLEQGPVVLQLLIGETQPTIGETYRGLDCVVRPSRTRLNSHTGACFKSSILSVTRVHRAQLIFPSLKLKCSWNRAGKRIATPSLNLLPKSVPRG